MKVSLLMVFIAVLAGLLPASALQQAITHAIVTVALDSTSPTSGIQEAVNMLPAGGGVVQIPPGDYLLRQSIRLRSGVTLQGTDGTILRKNKQVGSKLAAPTQGPSALVESASGFQEGDEIAFYDRTTVGWLHSHAVVTAIRGNELVLDRPPGRFDPANGAAVINLFSAIRAAASEKGKPLTGIVLQRLTVDGRSDDNLGPSVVAARAPGKPAELGFQFAAINIMDATGLRIDSCRVVGWPSDGISVQRGSGNSVTHCVVERCRGPGYHAGGGERDSVFSANRARANLGDGFYFCAKVTRVTVKDNTFVDNKANGVGALGEWGDRENVVENNRCEGNGMSGIALWDGESNTVRNNTCINNSNRQPGRWSGINLAATAKSIISGNQCSDTRAIKTQKHGIYESPNCRENLIENNNCYDNAEVGIALAGGRKEGNRE